MAYLSFPIFPVEYPFIISKGVVDHLWQWKELVKHLFDSCAYLSFNMSVIYWKGSC